VGELTGCGPPDFKGERVTIEPSYVFALGVLRSDVEAMLGLPEQPARYEPLSRQVELDYVYPFPAIQAETHFPNGVTRSEMVDRIAMFFDGHGILVRMASRTNRWYSTVIEQPVQRITVLPRLIHANGVITAPRAAPPEP
jgi:hypothetical protein